MKEKTAIGALPVSETRESVRLQFGKTALCALVGLLSANARVYGGIAPFGVSAAAAATGSGALLVYIATAIGYLLMEETLSAVRYIAAIAAVAGLRFALGGFPTLTSRRWFTAITASVATLSTGLVLASAGTGFTLYTVLMIAAESLLAGGFSCFFYTMADAVIDRKDAPSMTTEQQTAVVATAAVVLLAVIPLEIASISIGRIFSTLLILLFARAEREKGGAISGVVFGAAVAFGSTGRFDLAVAYAFGGLLAGLFSRFGKFATTGVFLAGSTVVLLAAGASVQMLISLYEVVAACVAFLVFPPSWERHMHAFFGGREEKPAVEGLRRSVSMRLEVASKAMSEVAGTVDAVSRKLAGVGAPDLGSIYFGVSDGVCRHCGLRMVCWEKEMSETMDAFNHLTPFLRERGMVEIGDLDGRLARKCMRTEDVVNEVNRGYAEHRLREGAWRRLSEIRAVVTDQFAGMAELLDEFSETFSQAERVDVDAAARVQQVCEDYRMTVEQVVCTVSRGERMHVGILASDTTLKLRQKDWLREIGNACGREFAPPQAVYLGDRVKLCLSEQPRYRVRVGSAQLCCEQERLCGDAYESFEDGEGRFWAVLSDGMGSGGRAAVDGAMAAGLTARLFKAGFGEDSVLRMVNSALMVKSEDESLATLDVLSVDLFSGRIRSLKAGAAVSLLCSKGRVSRLERSSLPVGILRDIAFEKQTDTLTDGDILLLCSDGALTDGVAWIEQELQAFNADESSPQMLAQRICSAARERQRGKRQDDVTVLAFRLERTSR